MKSLFAFVLAACVWCGGFPAAQAQTIIKQGSASHDHFLEIEPHAALTPFWPPHGSAAAGGGGGAWFGFNVARKGFLPQVNDSFSVVAGFDFLHYFGGPATASNCAEWQGSGSNRICVRTTATGGVANYWYIPVMAQWSFYIVPEFSAFAELGINSYFWSPRYDNYVGFGVIPQVGVGGRWHFSESVSLTFRLAYPYTTVGLSFFL